MLWWRWRGRGPEGAFRLVWNMVCCSVVILDLVVDLYFGGVLFVVDIRFLVDILYVVVVH